jgi:EAL domain-containing protein (putative c-di-GMP-specific phosphodiesterase class I)
MSADASATAGPAARDRPEFRRMLARVHRDFLLQHLAGSCQPRAPLTLRHHGVAPTSLILEITEGAVIKDPALAVRNMQLLRIAGVRFSLDDFGTGYSSLSQLSRLPLDELKIDRSFIIRAHERRDDVTIIMSTIELAHSMGLKVVAEGVETQEAWNLLRRLDCDLVQGYLVSRPLSVADTLAYLQHAQQAQGAEEDTNRQLRTLQL